MSIVGTFILAQGFLWSLAYGDASNLNPSGQGCVDPSGYLQCYQNNVDSLDSCMEEIKQTCSTDTLTECELACGYGQLAANIGCWLTSCWNQVYSCAYQETVLQYLTGADLEQGPTPVPYYPAPDNAPGGCVCNLGYIWGNFTVTYSLQNPCSAYDIVSAGIGPEASCQCCWDSSILSDIVEMCPHNDLSDLSIDQMLDAFDSGYNNSASDQCSILANGDQCVSSFGLDTVASTWYNPGQLPSGFPGTAPLSDTTDGGSLTSAPAPYTYSVFPSYISVITPAPYNAKNAAGTGTVVDTSSATGTAAAGTSPTGTSAKATSGITTGSTTGAASSPIGQKGTAPNLVPQISFGYGVWGLAMQMFACALLSGPVVA